jgi:hypothetical protein
MAKSDAFFIRGKVTTSGTDFAQAEIDLGSFVNLGVSKSTLLRIHRVDVQYMDNDNNMVPIFYDGAISGNQTKWQLTTQSQTAIVDMTDKSLCASGSLYSHVISAPYASGVPSQTNLSETVDLNPADFKLGYLVGVDTLYIGADNYAAWDTGDIDVCILLSCTLESATQANSVALALSQQ